MLSFSPFFAKFLTAFKRDCLTRLVRAMQVLTDRPQQAYVSRRFSDFLMESSFLNSNNCSCSVLAKKLAALHSTGRLRMQSLHATGGQSHINYTRGTASSMQIVPAWPPVAFKINKIDGDLHATGGHAGTICMRLSAT
jgi:hypothetical protein